MSEVPVPAPTATGIEAVDQVLDLVEGLAERTLEEHASILEDVHGQLRRTLDQPPTTSS